MPETGVFSRLRQGLQKTRNALTGGIPAAAWRGNGEDLLGELEDRLLLADVGVDATTRIIDDLKSRLRRKRSEDPKSADALLQESLAEIMSACNKPLLTRGTKPFTMLVVGISLTAAYAMLQSWGEKIKAPVVAQKSGADSAAVVFDAYQSAKARDIDVLIADTAGRLHTQQNLMDELLKIKRAMQKIEPEAPHEILLVIEAGTGQNALKQALGFHEALNLTGLCVTKLDGTAKGGTVIAIADRLEIPIRYIGVGEGIDDLRVFDAYRYAEALLHG